MVDLTQTVNLKIDYLPVEYSNQNLYIYNLLTTLGFCFCFSRGASMQIRKGCCCHKMYKDIICLATQIKHMHNVPCLKVVDETVIRLTAGNLQSPSTITTITIYFLCLLDWYCIVIYIFSQLLAKRSDLRDAYWRTTPLKHWCFSAWIICSILGMPSVTWMY